MFLRKLSRQTLQLFVVVAGVAIGTAVPAQQDWSVRADARREHKIVQRYRQLLLKNPDHAIAYRSLISKLGRGPALDPLIEDVRAVAEGGQNAEPYILLGHLERDRGRAGLSLAAYEQAVKLEPDNAATQAALGAALERAGRAMSANARFERALELTTSKSARQKLLRKLCDGALTRGDHPRAVQWMEAIVQLNPRDYGLRIELAETQLRAHQFDQALRSFEVAHEHAGRSGKRRAQTLIDIGDVNRRMHDQVAAEASYRRALKLVGKSSWMRREVLMRLLDVSRDLGSLAKMYDELRREWSAPSYHDAMVLAGIAEELGNTDDAVTWLERAMRLDRRAIEPRTRLIARLDHRKDAARVKRLYAEIVALRPDDLSQRLERIEWLFLRAGRAQEAMDELARLEKEVAPDPNSLVSIADTYLAFGLPDAALRIHEALQKSAPDHLVHLEAYGGLLTRLGRTDEAEKVWMHLFSVDTDEVGARLRVAEIAARQKNFDRAIELLLWVVEHYPRMVNARQRLAGVYEATKNWPKALQQWETLFFDYEVDHARRRVLAIAQSTVFIGRNVLSPDPELLARWEARYAKDQSVRTAAVLIQLRSIVDADAKAWALAAHISAMDPATLSVAEQAAWIEVARFMVRHASSPQAAIDLLERIADAFGDRRAASWREALDIAVRSNVSVDDVLAKALDASPNDPHVHATAGAVMVGRGETLAAIAHMRRAIALGTKSFDTHFDLALLLKDEGRLDEAREVYHTVIRTDWSGDWARSAVFSAIDICETDAQRRALVDELEGLRGRLAADDFYAIAVSVYGELFLYGDDPRALFQSLGTKALPVLVATLQADSLDDQARAEHLLQLYPAELVSRAALRTWPKTPKTWTEAMVRALARTGTSEAEEAVVAAIGSERANVREMAIFGAGLLRATQAESSLLAVAAAPRSWPELVVTAGALGRIGTPRSIEALSAMRNEQRSEVRALATWSLGQANVQPAAAKLAEELNEPDGWLAGTVLNAAGEHGLRELLRAAWSSDDSRRAAALDGLRSAADNDAWTGSVDGLVRPHHAIEEAIERASTPRHGMTARAFLGREQVVVDFTKQSLNDLAPRALGFLVDAVQEVEDSGTEDLAESLKIVVRGLRPNLRRLAQTAPNETLAPAVMLLPLAERQADVPLIARAAGRLPDVDAAEALERLSRYPWKSTRAALLDGMRAEEVLRRAASVRAISRSVDASDDPEVTDLIVALATDPAPEVQVAAIEALGRLRHADAVEMLTGLHDDAKPIVQQAIRGTLRTLPGDAAREAARRFEVRATLPVCEGDPDDLSDLLQDDCAGAVRISDF